MLIVQLRSFRVRGPVRPQASVTMVDRPSPSLQARCSLHKHGGTRLITRRPLSGSRPLATVLGRARRGRPQPAGGGGQRRPRGGDTVEHRRPWKSASISARCAPSNPGCCGAQDTFYVGNLKGVGRVYQQTFIDPYAVARPPSLTSSGCTTGAGNSPSSTSLPPDNLAHLVRRHVPTQ